MFELGKGKLFFFRPTLLYCIVSFLSCSQRGIEPHITMNVDIT